jgi:hypothetical protein
MYLGDRDRDLSFSLESGLADISLQRETATEFQSREKLLNAQSRVW